MKIWKITTALLLSLTLLGATACNAFGGDEETSEQPVEVVRGDLLISVSGSGNIETSREAMLNFGSGGRIERIAVEEGDEVIKGDILASLDTRTLELAKTQAEVALTQAEIALTQAQVARQTVEFALENTRDTEEALELALLQAQISVRTAKHTLDETRDIYTWPDIETAQEDVSEAEAFLEYVSERLDVASTSAEQTQWTITLTYAQARLITAEAKLNAMIQSYDTEEVAIAALQVEAAEMAEAQARNNLGKVAKEVALAELQVEATQKSIQLAVQSVDLVQQSLAETQKQLDEATITAPFSGVVASVNVKEDDLIPPPTIAPQTIIHLIDPTTMELKAEVDEIDIAKVQAGQRTIIEIDALPDVQFEGTVTSISQLPTMQAGVVLYEVKIDFSILEDSRLRAGMSASADIIINERSNILLVPDRAIGKDSQGRPIVKVIVDGETEERLVVVGLSDGFETEIIDGLSEGEVIQRKSS